MRKATKATKKRSTTQRAVRPGAKGWSPAEIGELKRLYKNRTALQVAKDLGRSLASVKAKIRTLNLKKPVAAKRRAAAERRAAAQKGTAKKATQRRGSAAKKATGKKAAARRR